MNKLLGTLGVLIALGALPAQADPPGCIPVFRQTAITVPGNYCVTRNISIPGGPVVEILADDVSLFVNEYTLEVTTGAGSVVRLDGTAGNSGRILVTGGTLRGGLMGVEVVAGSPRNVSLDGLTIVGSAAYGIGIGSAQLVAIEECTISNSGSLGIWVSGAPPMIAPILIRQNRIINPGDGGIVTSFVSYADIYGNQVNRFGGADPATHGIHMINGLGTTRYRIVGNSVTDGPGTGDGIHVGAGFGAGTIFGNTVVGNGGNGAWIESGTPRILDNHFASNGKNGMVVEGERAHIAENTVENNTFYGLTCGGLQDHLYTRNVMRGNPSGPVDPAGCEFSTDAGDNLY